MKKNPIKINNISSSLVVFNVSANQDINLNIPFNSYVYSESDFLKLERKESNLLNIKNQNLENINLNLYLGNVDIINESKKHTVCVFLNSNLNKNLYTIVNPKNQILKLSSNQVVHLVLYSNEQKQFFYDGSLKVKKLAYNIYKNSIIDDIFGSSHFQHHVWFKIFPQPMGYLKFFNLDQEYNFLSTVKLSKKNYYYIKDIKIIKKKS